MANDLEPYENITRVFWIRIELKENQRAGRQILGDIKDVRSGAIGHIRYLHDIIFFIIPYLLNMGVKVEWSWRLGSWLKQRRRKNNSVFAESIPRDGEHRANP